MKKLSIIIIAGNESENIKDCLNTCLFANEIIVFTNSQDNTVSLVKKYFPKVKIIKNRQIQGNFNFSLARNEAFKHSTSEWILFLDADERIDQKLQSEIKSVISENHPKYSNYDIPRANYFLGKRVKFGGNYPDYVKRLFSRQSFMGYSGIIHEQPKILGSSSVLTSDLVHLTHRSLNSMLEKSIKWTNVEADLLFKDHHPPVLWWRFFRMMLTKFWQRFVQQSMWRDGYIGLISVIFEMFDTYMIYSNLFELQISKSHD